MICNAGVVKVNRFKLVLNCFGMTCIQGREFYLDSFYRDFAKDWPAFGHL